MGFMAQVKSMEPKEEPIAKEIIFKTFLYRVKSCVQF